MIGLQLTSEVVVRITDTPGVDALDVFGPRIGFLLWSEVHWPRSASSEAWSRPELQCHRSPTGMCLINPPSSSS